jgi:hypothetical protein
MNDTFTSGAATCPTCGGQYLKDQPWKRVCISCYLDAKGRTAPIRYLPTTPTPIEPDMLRRLIYLTHPDKHGNSEAANTATRYLLALKGACHG